MTQRINLTEAQKDFYLKEYESLRKELEFLGNDLRSLEKYVVFSIAAVWGWLLTQGGSQSGIDISFLKLTWRGLPLIFSFIGVVRAVSLYRGIQKISQYLKDDVEKRFGIQGWEQKNKGISWEFSISLFFIWAAIFLAALFSPNPFTTP